MAQKNLSKLQENFTCLAIACVDLIKLPLIDILENHVKPSDLKTKLKSSPLISGDKLLPDQKKICYTNPGIPDYNQFDVSLLYKLIRNLCPLKPTKEWGKEPDPANTQLGDDIERLRLFRNDEFAHANSTEISDSEFKKQWTYLQTVINRIQSNKGAFCKSDYRQRLNSLEKRKLHWEDFENYKLLLKAALYIFQEREDTDGPDIWIEGPDKVVCGSTAHFKATVKEKRVSSLSVTWQKIINDKSKQIDKSDTDELYIESVCKKDEGKYQAILSFEENGVRKTIQSNSISLQVEGGVPDLTTSHETCLQTHSVNLIGIVFLIDNLPVIDDIFWSRDGNKIDTRGNEGKYSKVSVDVPSLTIYNVNQYDAGHYTLTATNAAGTTVSDAIVLGAPEIDIKESEEETDGSQVFTVTIKSIPTAYEVQWQVSDNNSDIFTPLDENAEEYRGTSVSFLHPVLVVRRKEQLKNNIFQIEVKNFIGGRRNKIPSILNMFYQDRGAGVMFAKLFNGIAETFPMKKLDRLQDLILDSCKDKELIPMIKNANSAREYLRILKEKELFTPSDVIFMQFLLKESNCGVLYEKCIAYATTQKALCFYEEPPTKDDEESYENSILGRKISYPNLENQSNITENNPETEQRGVSAPDSTCTLNIRKECEHMTDHWATQTDVLLVAAIDFGTTFSGYAFAMRDELNKDPSRINVSNWESSNGRSIFCKTSSTVLLNKNTQFVAFGFDAESKYAELSERREGEDYFYFHHFKMLLYDHAKMKNLNMDTRISDIQGRKLPAVTVFTCAIRYLKDRLLDDLKKMGVELLETDMKWVLTIPSIWDDRAKSFMRNAAYKAGIPMDQLILALEPEAASIYCKSLPAENFEEDTNTTNTFKPGSKYLVLDAGGGTVDITVHEVQRNRQLSELDRASGGGWGGICVDMAFKSVLAEIATKEVIEGYRHKYPSEYLELFTQFENIKRRFKKGYDLNSVTRLTLPFLNEECLNTLGRDFTTLISSSQFKDQIIVRCDKMRIKLTLFETFFQPPCSGIIKHMEQLFQSSNVRDVKNILMVGGFSESWILQECIRTAFPDRQVIVPKEAGLAVLRGAVMFGFSPNTVTSRIAKYTYGVDKNVAFNPAIHKESKREIIEGVEYCTGIFDTHVRAGEKIDIDEEPAKRYYIPVTPKQSFVSFRIYLSEESCPKYVDQCKLLGKVVVNVPVGSKNRMVYATMTFGRTELTVEAFVLETGEKAAAYLHMDYF